MYKNIPSEGLDLITSILKVEGGYLARGLIVSALTWKTQVILYIPLKNIIKIRAFTFPAPPLLFQQ